MTKCPECGAIMWRVGKSKDGIILRCSQNPNHILKKKITPEQKVRELCIMIGESPLQSQKKGKRFQRRNQEKRNSYE